MVIFIITVKCIINIIIIYISFLFFFILKNLKYIIYIKLNKKYIIKF